MNGAKLLVKTLETQGVQRVSSVAGESYLSVLDAFLDSDIEVITCRQEGGAAFMAESWGKATGQPGICFVTRGPGACNASIGVHTAMQDSSPMILFMGQVRRCEKGREAFQEIDVKQVFGGLAKWAVDIDDPDRIPEIVQRAFKVAMSGRPGPVVVGLPEDMLRQATESKVRKAAIRITPEASKAELDALKDILKSAQRPLAIVGGSGWSDETCASFEKFASACHLPVAASFRRQDLFSHNHSNYVGELGTGANPALLQKVSESDVLIVVGARLNEIMTQSYYVPDPDSYEGRIVHIHPSDEELGKVYETELPIQADVNSITHALVAGGFRIDGRSWANWKKELRDQYLKWSTIDLEKSKCDWAGANMTEIYDFLLKSLPENAVLTTDAGNFSGWAQRYVKYGRPGRLFAPISGAMGYSVPSAIGASLLYPDRLVLGLCGDGGFMMNGQELATAAHHGAKPIIMICNNGMYGTIRMHQERDYPGRVSATSLTNPDFVALAQSYGAFAVRVEKAEDFAGAWAQVMNEDRCCVIEVRMDPDQITTNARK